MLKITPHTSRNSRIRNANPANYKFCDYHHECYDAYYKNYLANALLFTQKSQSQAAMEDSEKKFHEGEANKLLEIIKIQNGKLSKSSDEIKKLKNEIERLKAKPQSNNTNIQQINEPASNKIGTTNQLIDNLLSKLREQNQNQMSQLISSKNSVEQQLIKLRQDYDKLLKQKKEMQERDQLYQNFLLSMSKHKGEAGASNQR